MAHDFVFDYPSLGLTTDDYLKEIGYRKSEPQPEVLELIRGYEQLFTDNLTTSCTFVLTGGECLDEKIVPDGTDGLSVGTILGNLLKKSERFAIFAATAGERFQAYYNEVKERNELLLLFILDIMGSCIVEKTGDLMEQCLENIIQPCKHTARFNPGYCGWPLTDQQKVFRLLGGHPCGISLSDACLMYPLKSISGVIGIGGEVSERKYGCNLCNLETCYKT